MVELLTFGRYLKKKYKKRVKKIPLAISGFTCPNIDGTVAKGGCTFCLNESFSPNVQKRSTPFFLNLSTKSNPILQKQLIEVDEQLKEAKREFKEKKIANKFIAYFQAFTNTYAPYDTLVALYEKALEQKDIIGLSIGTRSDSITKETLKYLASLSNSYEIWIEYGIQSIYDETLKKINRGHDSKSVERAIKEAKDLGLNVCGHLIFGLPGENKEMMLNSAIQSYEWGIDSVKYHPLYVVKGTQLALEYKRGEFKPISFNDYLDILIEAISLKPSHISIQRVSAGIDDDTLLAPKWCGYSKNFILSKIREELRSKGYIY